MNSCKCGREKVAKAIKKWCRARKLTLSQEPCHIHARAYVVGYAAPQCLVVAVPWVDSEPQLRSFDKENPLTTLNTFDVSLMPGDWCSTAYVCYEGVQETVAIQVVA